MKNRDGEADMMVSLGFIGQIGMFFEIPRTADMTEDVYKRFEAFRQTHS